MAEEKKRIVDEKLYKISYPVDTHKVASKREPGALHTVVYANDGDPSKQDMLIIKEATPEEIAEHRGVLSPTTPPQPGGGLTPGQELLLSVAWSFLEPIVLEAGTRFKNFVFRKASEGIDALVERRRQKKGERPHLREDETTSGRKGNARAAVAESHDVQTTDDRKDSAEIREQDFRKRVNEDAAKLEEAWERYQTGNLKAHEVLLRHYALARCITTVPMEGDDTSVGATKVIAILREDPKLSDIANLEEVTQLLLDESLWESSDDATEENLVALDVDALNEIIRKGREGLDDDLGAGGALVGVRA